MATVQYWDTTAQKFQFVSEVLGTHTCYTNPVTYTLTPMTKAQASVPVQPGYNSLSGGVEFAAAAVPLAWDEMNYGEYEALAPFFYQPCTMIDTNDQGFFGWLIPGTFDWQAGTQTKVGKVTMTFVVSKPANGVTSTINTLASGPTISAAVSSTGGSIPASSTLYYAATNWSNWGEGTLGPVTTVSIPSAAGNYMVALTWDAPTSAYFRKTRIYMATESGILVAGSSTFMKAEVYAAWTQSWNDYCGTNGVTSTATIPSSSQAYTGIFAGSIWVNQT